MAIVCKQTFQLKSVFAFPVMVVCGKGEGCYLYQSTNGMKGINIPWVYTVAASTGKLIQLQITLSVC